MKSEFLRFASLDVADSSNKSTRSTSGRINRELRRKPLGKQAQLSSEYHNEFFEAVWSGDFQQPSTSSRNHFLSKIDFKPHDNSIHSHQKERDFNQAWMDASSCSHHHPLKQNSIRNSLGYCAGIAQEIYQTVPDFKNKDFSAEKSQDLGRNSVKEQQISTKLDSLFISEFPSDSNARSCDQQQYLQHSNFRFTSQHSQAYQRPVHANIIHSNQPQRSPSDDSLAGNTVETKDSVQIAARNLLFAGEMAFAGVQDSKGNDGESSQLFDPENSNFVSFMQQLADGSLTVKGDGKVVEP